MALLRLDNVCLSFGEREILDAVDLSVTEGERVCLLGRNGEGKSTLMKVIAGQIETDDGEVWIRPGYRIGFLQQDSRADASLTVRQNVEAGLPSSGTIPAEHEIDALISKLDLPAESILSTLSGGWRRRAMLARALVASPDLLLLDEPTNHLDIAAINWLERFMLEFQGALLFVSHDRMFADRLASRVIELDRGRLGSWPGTMAEFQRRKAAALAAEEKANAEFDKKLAQEEAWVRQGIKARRTRNEGRVRALKAMREQQQLRRESLHGQSMALSASELSGKIVVDCLAAEAGYGDKKVLQPFDVRVLRGDRIGVVGPNGSGKSTLIKLLAGELKPIAGNVYHGTRLEPAYFDQQRAQLDDHRSLRDNVNGGSDYIEVQGKRTHVAGYLRRFLFPPSRFDTPVSVLSGGERNRLLLAKLLARPTNFMILDEPTNDLDVETLELLEDMLVRFDATLIIVSHDRAFLDNVVNGIIHVSSDGHVREYVGNYSDFERVAGLESPQREKRDKASAQKPAKSKSRSAAKLKYKEQAEFDRLPEKIEALEACIAKLTAETERATFYAGEHEHVAAILAELAAAHEDLDKAYTRWDELDARAAGGSSRAK